MTKSAKHLAGLRQHYARRRITTRSKLLDALERMESGQTRVVLSNFSWSKTALAREACVNINTVVKKLPSGKWAFPEVNERFEMHKRERMCSLSIANVKEQKIIELRLEVERLGKENRRLALEVNRIGRQLLEERYRADRMAEYERQNLSLRKEINRMQQAGFAQGNSMV